MTKLTGQQEWKDLAPPNRILMGPGPSNVDPRVLRVMSHQTIGHLDPEFLNMMGEVRNGLKQLFQTENELTFPISGTGSAGMEACLTNMIEPNDRVLVCVKGFFSDRMAMMAKRLGADVIVLEQEWGMAFEPERVCEAIKKHRPKLVCIVHAETSTGVLQPLDEIAKCVREHDAFLLLDVVTSLGGMPVLIDEWGIDVAFSATQKCVGTPPGLAPVTFNQRTIEALERRKVKPTSWYFDALTLRSYWGEDRAYHHTAPINMVFALREALRLIVEEGLEARWERHRINGLAIAAGLEAMGLKLLVTEPSNRLPMLTPVLIPEGVDDLKIRRRLLDEFYLEIGAGLGSLKGRIWRFGLMGYSSQKRNVFLALSALGFVLQSEGIPCDVAAGISVAQEVYQRHEAVKVEV